MNPMEVFQRFKPFRAATIDRHLVKPYKEMICKIGK